MEIVDVFSDASCCKDCFGGAFVVGRGGKPVGVELGQVGTSMAAELITSHHALVAARREHPAAILVLHSDLDNIQRIIAKGRTRAAAMLGIHDRAGFRNDGNQFPEHRRCHIHARIMAGRYGTRHPALVQHVGKRRWSARYGEGVLSKVALHPDGISFANLAKECGLSYSLLMKVVHELTLHSKIYCLAACDLERWTIRPKTRTA